jgi:hypothetical protein
MNDPVGALIDGLLAEYGHQSNAPDRKWEFWADGRCRRRTICVTLCPRDALATISCRAIGTDGCMSTLNLLACDLENLPKLIHALNRALVVANKHGLIKQTKK